LSNENGGCEDRSVVHAGQDDSHSNLSGCDCDCGCGAGVNVNVDVDEGLAVNSDHAELDSVVGLYTSVYLHDHDL